MSSFNLVIFGVTLAVVGKSKGVHLYSTYPVIMKQSLRHSDMDHTLLPANTPSASPYLVGIPQMAPPLAYGGMVVQLCASKDGQVRWIAKYLHHQLRFESSRHQKFKCT